MGLVWGARFVMPVVSFPHAREFLYQNLKANSVKSACWVCTQSGLDNGLRHSAGQGLKERTGDHC